MPRIALVTYAAAPDLTLDDRLLRTALEAAGAEVAPVVWSEEHEWTAFDLVVLRSTWDYFHRPEEFASWLGDVERAGVDVLNPLKALRWNGDKRYLRDLDRKGVEIIPTIFLDRDAVLAAGAASRDGGSLASLLQSRGWSEAVVKPSISGGAHGTWRTSARDAAADEGRFRALRESCKGDVMIQPFMPEVVADGELSLIFLDGVYSHAAVKRPKPGDFRVQQEHGGHYAPHDPSADLTEQAGRVVEAAAASAGVSRSDLLYARVDGVVQAGFGGSRFLLMELECIEPSLFFLQHPAAAERMARSLVARLGLRAGG